MRNLGFALIAVMLCWAETASATTYAYDPAGRMVAAIASDGSSAVYVYDTNGNITGIQRLLASNLAIFAFAAPQGVSGQQVTIQGSGFSTTPSSNTVKFNGVAATVVSSTVNQLIATVPSTATTGLISVTVGTTTAISSQSFTVVNPLLPTITSFTPVLVDFGSSVTLTGTNFNPVTGETSVHVGGTTAPISSLTATHAVFAPQVEGSGPIQINTPYGQATSSTELIVAPGSVGAANIIASNALIQNGSSHTLNINQQNKYGVFTFDAVAGQWLSMQLSALTISPSGGVVTYQLYSSENELITSGTVSSTAMSIHLPQITVTGTYLVAFNTPGETAQLTATLENNPTLSINSAAIAVTTANVGQSKRVIFSATAGQTVAIYVNSIVTTPANVDMYYWVYDSTGTVVTANAGQPTETINLPSLASGTYSVIFQGYDGYNRAAATGQVSMVSGVAATLPANGTGANYATTKPGQIGYFSFAGTAGQSLGLALTHLVITPDSLGYLYVPVQGPNGIQDLYCYTADPGCQLSLVNLPQTGTYTIALDPWAQATMSFALTLSQDAAGTLALNTPQTVSLPAAGQNALLKFTASAGQTVTLTVDLITTTPSTAGVSVSVYDPAWNLVYGLDSLGQPSLTMSLSNLAGGTYNVLIAPDYAATASARVTIQ